jgi:hypothetical protein
VGHLAPLKECGLAPLRIGVAPLRESGLTSLKETKRFGTPRAGCLAAPGRNEVGLVAPERGWERVDGIDERQGVMCGYNRDGNETGHQVHTPRPPRTAKNIP